MALLNLAKHLRLGLVLACAGLLVAACSPAMRTEKSPGSLAWFDLVTESPDVARGFYTDLFGWSFAQGPSEQTQTISGNGEFIGGLVTVPGSDKRNESQWTPVLSVADTMATVQTVKSSGGRLTETPIATPNGTFADIKDNSGASVTLYDGNAGVPLGSPAKFNTWIWADLLTSQTTGAKRFYKSVAGFDTRHDRTRGENFTVFTLDGRNRGGLVRVPRSQVEPNWLPYVLVADLDSTIAKARNLGGSVLIREGGTAVLLDPAGAAIGVTTRQGGSQ